ncbi:MBL fold metallo-hydrolase [Prauserella cavernicola]|uniref:MBL fold metallo-hydrolase n=1 Tax=Prauserella cavernicola TaxID=2800127 RepID=A0A934QZE7_9PSEU|nr:MBL fold metallo-hydrolase [Prauserella cavernicola]MBK1788099.1 MBL fold metallo-hydrolase [Prauserella cavernicola]
MLVVGFAAGAFQANCYVLATGAGGDCVIVDPGEGAREHVDEALREHGLTPAAVLATHGHFDHVHSAAEIADAHGVAVWIRPEDRVLLSDPLKGLGPELAAAFASVSLTEPRLVRELGTDPLELAGMRVELVHTPGHTPGSVVFRLDTDEGGRIALTGDTLFAGSIGRTDLPGGDSREIASSLRTLLACSDDTVVLPGHGPTTTIGRERATNPFVGDGGGMS